MNALLSIAWAQGAQQGPGAGASLLVYLPMMVIVFVLFYFLLFRPEQQRRKRTQDMLQALKKGDKVVTIGGIWGTVTNLGKESVTLQIADNTKIRVQRESISRLRADEEE
jgi:preprotein translocase subunit YajC